MQPSKQRAVRISHWSQVCGSVKICWHRWLIVFLIPAIADRDVVCQSRFEFSARGFGITFELPEVPRAIPRALTVGSIAQAADESADIAVIVEGAGAVYTICGRSRPSACTNVHELHTAAIALGGTVQVNVSAFWAFHLRFSSLNGKTSCQLLRMDCCNT